MPARDRKHRAGQDARSTTRGCGRDGRSEPRMISFFTQTQQGVLAALFFVVGVVVGRLANLWSIALTRSATTADSADFLATQNLAMPESVSRAAAAQRAASNSGVAPDVTATAEPAEAALNEPPQPDPTRDFAASHHGLLGRGFGMGAADGGDFDGLFVRGIRDCLSPLSLSGARRSPSG